MGTRDDDRRSEGGRVLSIADRIEQRKMARLREQSAKMHVRSMETAVAWLDMRKQLETMDLDGQLAALATVDTTEARWQRGEARSLRGLQSCLRGDVEAGMAEWDEVSAEVPELSLPHFFRARWMMDTDPKGALVHFDHAAALAPRDANVYWRRGDCHTKLGDHERALANYRRALSLDPSSIDGLYATANALVALGRPREALRYYDDAIARAPKYVDFLTSRGIALEVLDEHAAAVRDYERILAIDPSNVVARFSRARCRGDAGDYGPALEELTALAADHPDEHHVHLLRGKLLIKTEQWAAAEATLARAIELAPDEAEAWGQHCLALARLGDRSRAADDAARAAALSPKSPEYVYFLIAFRYEPSDFDGKIAALADPIARFPDTWLFLHERAELYGKRGDHESALRDWDAMVASWPIDPECRIGRAKSLAALDRHAEALEDLARVRETDPDNAMAHALSAHYSDTEDGDAAVVEAHWARAVALAPDDLAIRYHHGQYLVEREKYEAAIADFDRVVAVAPAFGEGYYQRGSARYHIDDEHADDDDWFEEDDVHEARMRACVADFERALELGYREDDVFLDLHWARWDVGDHAGAIAALELGMEAFPDAPFFYDLRHHRRRELHDEAGAEADRLRAEELRAAAKATAEATKVAEAAG